ETARGVVVYAIKQVRKRIERDPKDPQSLILRQLILSLQNNEPFELGLLYELEPELFDYAFQIMKEWRLDRHYAKKQKLLDAIE
ncbi:hypothetical protein RZS08_29200, partial [Arthrospira platensis SPKY1]|nr:hypothetical protein [Arthrospira platensis SPKY1]